jgi:hypothetical protein
MPFTSKMKKNALLLSGCLVFVGVGLSFLFMAALIQINPDVQHFSGLFHHESLMNLVYSLIPAIK